MHIHTRHGLVDTERAVRPGERPEWVQLVETLHHPSGRTFVARLAVVRDLYEREPGIRRQADEELGGRLRQEVREYEATLPRVADRENVAPNPAIAGLRTDYLMIDEPLVVPEFVRATLTDQAVRQGVAERIRSRTDYSIGTYATTNAFTWTATNAYATGGAVPPPPREDTRVERIKNPKNPEDCACGNRQDPNWEHHHDECTFLDRPSSEWIDEGAA